MSMVERVAQIIDPYSWTEPGFLMRREVSLRTARSAIEAMREPTPAMQRAVAAQWGHRTWGQYGDVIDAALKENA